MKYIDKGPTPDEMQKWVNSWVTSHGGAKPMFSDFNLAKGQSLKRRVKKALMDEQGRICCYCMQRISISKSHMEHFHPRCLHHDKEVDYQNFFLSCGGEGGDGSHCGILKDDEDTPMLICPTDVTVEANFQYGIQGDIHSGTPEGNNCITVLGLQTSALQGHRLAALDGIGYFSEDFDEEKREEARQECLQKDADGAFVPFCTATLYCLDHF